MIVNEISLVIQNRIPKNNEISSQRIIELDIASRENTNLLITPHCGGYSHDAVRIVCRRATEKVIKFFQDA